MSVFTELKRRNVFKVGIAYLVVAWLLTQVVGELSGLFALPDGLGRSVVILLAVGFPIALIVSWIYEASPQGLVTQEAVDAGAPRSSGRKLNAVIVGGLALALAFVVLDAYVLNDPQAPVPVAVTADEVPAAIDGAAPAADLEYSIAVLPFANLSDDPEQEYFSDGLSEELLNKLAQVEGLLVTARTSSFYYKGRNEDMRTIGAQLGVNYILEGSVRKSADQLRITAQLIQADNGFHLWSQTYDRTLDDIFVLQDEIADAVTTALSVTLGVGGFDQPGMTRNVEAYDEYLKARQSISQSTDREGASQAMEHFERAVSLDPTFFRAWAELLRANVGTAELFPAEQARANLQRGAEVRQILAEKAPELPEARAMEIRSLMNSGNYVDAEPLVVKLIADTGGSSSPFNILYASLLQQVGRSQAALLYRQAARRIDPADFTNTGGLARLYLDLGRNAEALAEVERGLTFATGEVAAVLRRTDFWVALQEGNREAAAQALRASGGDLQSGSLADHWARGDDAAALEVLRTNLNADNNSQLALAGLSAFAYVLGEHQLSLDIHRQARELNNIWMPFTRELRQLPDFKLFMEEMGIADYWRSTGNWADKCRPLPNTETDFECF